MSHLTLHAGPRLTRVCRLDGVPPYDEDVTDRAVEFLFDRLVLTPELRLRDLFGLFECCPALQTVYRRLHARELLAEAALGSLPNDDPCPLMYLELRQSWEYDSHTRTYAELRRFTLDGVGEPPPDDECVTPEADGLVRYTVLGMPIRLLLDLPVRLDDTVGIFESDRDSCNACRQISRVHSRDLSLGDLLHSVLWDMTWFGTPDETQEVVEEMAELAQAPEAWQDMSSEDLTELFCGDSHRHACRILFESTGLFSEPDILEELRRIPDAFPARQWLNKRFGKQVKLRPAFRRLRGRELRRAFREAEQAEQPQQAVRDQVP